MSPASPAVLAWLAFTSCSHAALSILSSYTQTLSSPSQALGPEGLNRKWQVVKRGQEGLREELRGKYGTQELLTRKQNAKETVRQQVRNARTRTALLQVISGAPTAERTERLTGGAVF